MFNSFLGKARSSPALVFSVGWCLILLALLIGIGAPWNTFMLTWKVELVTSIFLIVVLIYLLRNRITPLISSEEFRFIILPMIAFIAWSAISVFYAQSWKSAVHHTLVWVEYLVFYLAVRHFLDREKAYGLLLISSVVALALIFFPTVSGYIGLLVFGGANPLGIKFARYGEIIATILPLVLFGVVRLRGYSFAIGVAGVIAMWLIVFCSVGRISNLLFLSLTAVVAFAIFAFRRLHEYRRRIVAVIACMIIAPAMLQTFSLLADKSDVPLFARMADNQSIASSNDFRKMMITLSFEMIRENPIVGVGADNFGFSLNSYRAAYGTRVPTDPRLAVAEEEIPERAHNEYLQIVAELGVVGGALFLWFLSGIAFVAYRSLGRRPRSPFPYAALLGVAAFLVSSLVSSFSFRIMQNGLVFFLILAVAVKLAKLAPKPKIESVAPIPMLVRASAVAAILACVSLISYSVIRAASVAMTLRGDRIADIETARESYETAMWLDDENPEPRSSLGLRFIYEKRYPDAISMLKESIRIGKGTSAEYSYLATAQRLAGDRNAVEETFSEAAALYPRSTFVLTRYSAALRDNGKTELSNATLARAVTINSRTANTWWAFINDGSRAASEKAFASSIDFVPVMDLWPQSSIYALKAERDILYPEERVRYNFNKSSQ